MSFCHAGIPNEVWKVSQVAAVLSVMVVDDGQVLADTGFSDARLHMPLSGGIGSCDSNTSFQLFPDFRIAVTVF